MAASASIARIVLIFSAESFFKERRIIIIIYSVGALGVEFAIGRISLLRGILWIKMRLALMSELSAGIRVKD